MGFGKKSRTQVKKPQPREIITHNGRQLQFLNGFWWPVEGSAGIERFMVGNKQHRGRVTYQLDSLLHAISHDKRRQVAIDVGAHFGMWTRVLAMEYKRVEAFEPLPIHFDCLVLNVPNDNVEAWCYALGNEDGQVKLELDNVKGLLNRLAVPKSECPLLWVTGRRLDGLSAYMNDISFIKIDVEGAELAVLQGAVETIARCKPVICMEQKDLGKDYRPGESQFAACHFLKEKFSYKVAGHVRDDWVMVPA